MKSEWATGLPAKSSVGGFLKAPRLILFRHGDKKMESHSNPELNPLGLVKARKIAEQVSSHSLPLPEKIWCSPKIRTRQTLLPVAESLHLPLGETALLNESQPQESQQHFDTRIEKFIELLQEEKSRLHFACSHYDWVIRFCEMGLGADFPHHTICHHWRPCQFIDFEILFDASQSWRLKILNSGVVE